MVVLFNPWFDSRTSLVTWDQLNLQAPAAQVRDLWAQKDLGVIETSYSVNLASHDSVMLKVTATSASQSPRLGEDVKEAISIV